MDQVPKHSAFVAGLIIYPLFIVALLTAPIWGSAYLIMRALKRIKRK